MDQLLRYSTIDLARSLISTSSMIDRKHSMIRPLLMVLQKDKVPLRVFLPSLNCFPADELLRYSGYFLTESLDIISTTTYQQQSMIRRELVELLRAEAHICAFLLSCLCCGQTSFGDMVIKSS